MLNEEIHEGIKFDDTIISYEYAYSLGVAVSYVLYGNDAFWVDCEAPDG